MRIVPAPCFAVSDAVFFTLKEGAGPWLPCIELSTGVFFKRYWT